MGAQGPRGRAGWGERIVLRGGGEATVQGLRDAGAARLGIDPSCRVVWTGERPGG
ncbi:hypothetical protein T484DRAFT_1774658 [Baffinella frigidus]|nr:hypothetical protein T484DRAFT_1774658 [Cryptophyta sp. CCMP2293]